MLWLGLALSLAGGASIHSQQAAIPVGHEQVVAVEGDMNFPGPAVPVADGGVGFPRSSGQVADGGVGFPRHSVAA